MSQIVHVFPAFTIKYTGKEVAILNEADYPFLQILDQCSDIIQTDLSNFDINNNNFLNDEIRNQYMSYIFSCAYSDILNKKNIHSDIIAGFSMGLYAGLYHAGSIDFKTGLLLIKDIYEYIESLIDKQTYTLASVIGFHENELKEFLSDYRSIEIIIQNGIYSFVIVGYTNEVSDALEHFIAEGVIHLGVLEVSCPYHSGLVAGHADTFQEITKKFKFKSCTTPLISMVDQSVIYSNSEIAKEIVKNVTSPLNFFRTVCSLESRGFSSFIEVGAGDSLLKSSKFIEGNFTFKAISKGKVLI